MAATYTIPDKVKFDEESLQILADASITQGLNFSLSNIRAEAPADSSGASRVQCLRALCTIEDVHLQLLTLVETSDPPTAVTGKGTTFSLNFSYSTGSQGCQIQFYVYTKIKSWKRGKGALGDM
ncbi:hypothetical protein EON65_42590 [archaeon]|nr:MAG: hypothetical protein EON65_42590 [archaeon]